MAADPPAPPRIFLSYSWDSDDHKKHVLALAQKLRDEGVDAQIDRFTTSPAQGWPQWMLDQIEEADFVLLVFTETYARRFSKKEIGGKGLGAIWEGAVITQDLYDGGGQNTKFVPIVLSDADAVHIAKTLKGVTHFRPATAPGYDALYRHLTGQPEIVPKALGALRVLSSSTSLAVSSVAAHSAAPTAKAPPLAPLPIHNHASIPHNLPRLQYFFGREGDLKKIADALAADARGWGALIDGPGGIGKTALAIRAAELVPSDRFQRIIFLSAKERELTADGQRALGTFVLPTCFEMLNAIARELEQPELTKSPEAERPELILRALREKDVLLLLDNLETLPTPDRDQLFAFLNRLPRGTSAIVTSRRRADAGAVSVRLDRLDWEAARTLIAELGKDFVRLGQASDADRRALYDETGGNPLLIRWVAGQLGRGRYRTVADALGLLRSPEAGNNPLQFVFGDLLDTFTANETKILSALTHFTAPIAVKFIAELGGVNEEAAQGALSDLSARALVLPDVEERCFVLVPIVADFLRRSRPEVVAETGDRLEKRAYALIVENGYQEHERFPVLDAAWPSVAPALARFVAGPNDRLQTICDALQHFLEFTGRWDESLALSQQGETKAVAASGNTDAGWRAFQVGWVHYLRGQADAVLACADRAAAHWEKAFPQGKGVQVGIRERAIAILLRGHGYSVKKDYPAAIAAYREAVGLYRSLSAESEDVAIALNDLAEVERFSRDFTAAEHDYREALRVGRAVGYAEVVAESTGNLAGLALDRKDWPGAEALAFEALALSEKVGRRELIAAHCHCLAIALVRQGKGAEALPYVRRAVEIYTRLGSPDLERARETLRVCEDGLAG